VREPERRISVEGILQTRVLVRLIDGPASGTDLMSELDLSSPGTIYPVLKALKRDGYIENASDWTPGRKRYVLSDKGKEQIKIIMLGIGRRYFAHYVDPYVSSIIDELKSITQIDSEKKALFVTMYEHEPIRQWLTNTKAKYIQIFEEPPDIYDFIVCCMVGTLMSSGWRTDEFSAYFPKILKSLRPGGTLIVVENEKTDNIYVEMFFKEIVGFGKPPGFSKEELRNLLESYNLSVTDMLNRRGFLIGVSTKPN
jgi:DNA-binding PadR family transcriptional regulator